MAKRTVFLDRDGTIIEDTGFVRRIEDVKLLPQAGEAIRRLNEAGFLVVVVSNQSGVARGLLTENDVAATNKRMVQLLKKSGAKIDALYYCPHLFEGKVPEYAVICECRKPRPGMLLKAAEELDIDLAESFTVGDAPRDVEAGLNAGTRTVLLTQSATRAEEAPKGCVMAEDLVAAVEIILEEAGGEAEAATEPPVVRRKPSKRMSRKRAAEAKSASERPQLEPAGEPPEEERVIPIHRAPKEFTPETEPAEMPEEPEEEATSEAVEPEEPEPPTEAPGPEPAESEPTPEEAEVESPGLIKCSRCEGIIYDADVEAGRAYRKGDVALCRECVIILQAQKTQPRDVSNDELLRELQNITRALTFERFSVYHIFGMIAQAGALGALIVMWAKGVSGSYGLLWAIFLQLLALTLFILGRQ